MAEIDPDQQQGRDLSVLAGGELQAIEPQWYPLSAAGQVLDRLWQGQPHLVRDLAARASLSPLEQNLRDRGIHAYVSVPLLVQDVLLGALNLSSDTPDFFRPEQIEILTEVAASLAVALQQARLLEEARQAAETRALLLREVNHRVKNNLDAIIGLLYIERQYAPDEALPAYGAIMEDLTQRIMGLAKVHQLLSEAGWTALNLAELAEQIIQSAVRGARDEVRIDLDIAPSPVRVGPGQAHHLALILSELATNTLKHGLAGRDAVHIGVQIEQAGDWITLTYRNDGPDYPDDVLSLARLNAGLDIVQRSVQTNLQGELALRNDGGAVTEIRFRGEGR
jgi:two-component sensor histidine kinase